MLRGNSTTCHNGFARIALSRTSIALLTIAYSLSWNGQAIAASAAAHLPAKPGRELAIDASVTSIAVSQVSVHPVQTVLRITGTFDMRTRTLQGAMPVDEGELIAVGQRARAFRVDSRTSMYQARISAVRREGDQVLVEATLAAATDVAARTYVLEINANRGDFLAVPNEAIIEEGEHRVVYLQLAGSYVPREVVTGIQGERYTQIVSGVNAGDWVVTLGTFFVDAEYRMKGDSSSAAQVRTIPTAAGELTVMFRVDPDPPRSGDNRVEVSLRRSDGTALSDAAVSAMFYMPAMPAMNMPEMHSDFRLTSNGSGSYSGSGTLVMSGTWNVTVRVTRGGEQLGTAEYTVIAK